MVRYKVKDIIDWTQSGKEIAKASKRHELVTFFHGHAVLFEKTRLLSERTQQKSDRVKFELDHKGNILIPSHGIEVSKYKIEIRTDQFEEIPIDDFTRYYPECKNLEFTSSLRQLGWNEVCELEKRNYEVVDKKTIQNPKNRKKASPQVFHPRDQKSFEEPVFAPYTQRLYEQNKQFCNIIADKLPRNSKVLDLGASNEPWFSCLCAKNGLRVYAFDISEPSDTKLIQDYGITYISDEINNLSNYLDLLTEIDFIFCRHLSPAQRLWNWHDENFVAVWKTILQMLSDTGVIYWEQMTNGSGIADAFFPNHTLDYFEEFFDKLGATCNLTRYGYAAFKIQKNESRDWSGYEIIRDGASDKENLFEKKDYQGLIKNYALQLQPFCSGIDREHHITITGKPDCAKIAKILLSENFAQRNVTIKEKDVKTTIQAGSKEIILDDIGLSEDNYYLLDGTTDSRITDLYYGYLKQYNLYSMARKYPKINTLRMKLQNILSGMK